MFRFLVLIASLLSVASFTTVGRRMTTSLKMGVEDLGGAAAAQEGGLFDPIGLSKDKDDATLKWYRAAELKHGRVSMVASLGLYVQSLQTGILPNPAFQETNPFAALKRVYTEDPAAIIQIALAIAAVEVLGASIEAQNPDGRPGDFGWDPANIRPKSEEKLEEFATKELKNGRLAMIGVAGLLVQSSITGGAFPFF